MEQPGRFWIWGEDEQPYGPADVGELRQWIMENRAGVGTWIAPASGDAPEPPALVPPAPPWQQLQKFFSLHVAIAPLWKRAAAYLIDSVLLSGVLALLLLGLVALRPEVQARYVEPVTAQLREGRLSDEAILVLWVAQGIYWTYFHGRSGQTPGKRWLGLRVVTLTGQSIGWGRAATRAVLALLGGFFYGAGYLVAFWSSKRQALHDWLAGTVVVEERAG